MYVTNILDKNINLFYSHNISSLALKNAMGSVSVKMPSCYYYNIVEGSGINFLFVNKFFYKSFVKHLFTYYNTLIKFYFVKFRIRGLGYHIRQITENFYYFFFNYTNYYYLYLPISIRAKVRKKRMILVSQNWQLLKSILSNILILKKLSVYRWLGIRIPKQFILLKKSSKSV